MSPDPDADLAAAPGLAPSDAARPEAGDDTPRAIAIPPHCGPGPWLPQARGAFAAFGASPLTLVYGAPWRAINTGRTYYVVCLDGTFDRYRTSDGRPFSWCVRRGLLDFGLRCGLR